MPRRAAHPLAGVIAAGLAGGVACLLVACAVAAPEAPATESAADVSAPPAELAASVLQSRQDVVDGRLVVQVDNGTDAALTIDRLVVRSPALADEGVVEGPKQIPAGRSVQYRVDLPDVTCEEPGEVAAVVELTGTVDHSAIDGELPTTDPYDTIARVQNDGCLAEAVERIVTITPPERLRSTGSGVDRRAFIDLTIEPAGASPDSSPDASGDPGTVSVRRILGTTLLSAEGGLNWPITAELTSDGEPSVIELPVRPARCDPHAGAEDKRGTILPLEVVTSDGWSGLYEVRSGAALKQDLFAYFTERCGLPGG
ncbi:hypothetical protein [Agromyces sp. LHK192]|uniref:hypothetical protein n=1 Tax=Agromyces sp. LHK192 TaxID=2498704 RepID=UPI000FDA3A35|nr:hypothetical protein [Agromyces sp. LHK192]